MESLERRELGIGDFIKIRESRFDGKIRYVRGRVIALDRSFGCLTGTLCTWSGRFYFFADKTVVRFLRAA